MSNLQLSCFRLGTNIGIALFLGLSLVAQTGAPPQVSPAKLPLKAEIVLSPDFCATKKRQSLAIKDVLNVGKATCAQLYSALNPVFLDLKRLEKLPTSGNNTAQITLVPRFVDISATQQPLFPSSKRELVILLEWTIQDATGHTVWLQTVQGTSEHKAGWIVTAKRVAEMVDAAVSDLANESVARISAARELQKLAP